MKYVDEYRQQCVAEGGQGNWSDGDPPLGAHGSLRRGKPIPS